MPRQTGGIFRTTVSIPSDLKARMDAVTEPVNWSSVAARAFEEKLAEIASRKQEKNMSDVMQRLRASKLRGQDERTKAGHTAGVAWARSSAEVSQLESLSAFLERLDGEPSGRDEFFSDYYGSSAFSTAERLFKKIEVNEYEKNDRGAAAAFWKDVAGEEKLDDAFLRGFAEGVESFWVEVRDQLD